MQRVINGEALDQERDAPNTSEVEPVTDLLSEETIRNIQTALNANGYYKGDADGKCGPKTEEAITRYQQDHGLSIARKADRGTVKSLGLEIISIPQE